MITDFTDFNGRPITPGVTVVIAVETKGRPRLAFRKGKVYRVSLTSIGVAVERPDSKWGPERRGYKCTKHMIIVD